jgi:hypothetical protein
MLLITPKIGGRDLQQYDGPQSREDDVDIVEVAAKA